MKFRFEKEGQSDKRQQLGREGDHRCRDRQREQSVAQQVQRDQRLFLRLGASVKQAA
jgi:hypothetical protein